MKREVKVGKEKLSASRVTFVRCINGVRLILEAARWTRCGEGK